MTTIYLNTFIQAPVATCFDLARDIDLHQASVQVTGEKVVAGKMHGLCEPGDEITWQARHFGFTQQLTVRITQLQYPVFFEDVMLKGAFTQMRHRHHFRQEGAATIMTDEFSYTVPFGIAGRWFNRLVLQKYMTRFLASRNAWLKETAERNSRQKA